MQAIQELLETNASLTADEKQLLVYLAWLLQPVDACRRDTVLTRLSTRLTSAGLDHTALMDELEDTITQFEASEL